VANNCPACDVAAKLGMAPPLCGVHLAENREEGWRLITADKPVDYDFLERANKQGGFTAEQQEFYERGWECAMRQVRRALAEKGLIQ